MDHVVTGWRLIVLEFVNRTQISSTALCFESSCGSCRYPRALRRDDQSIRAGRLTDSPNRSQSLVGQTI
jgi:hypothetical protein